MSPAKTAATVQVTAAHAHTAATGPVIMGRPALAAQATVVHVVPTVAATTERTVPPALRTAAHAHTAETLSATALKIVAPALRTVAHAHIAVMDMLTAQISATTEITLIAMDALQAVHTRDAVTALSAAPSSAMMVTTTTTMVVTQAAILSVEMEPFKVQRHAMIQTPHLEMDVTEVAL